MQKGRHLPPLQIMSVVRSASLRPRAPPLPLGRANLVAPLLMGRLETLLAAKITEDAGRFDATLEAPEQLLECLALAGDYVHACSFSLVSGRPGGITGLLVGVTKRADASRPASELYLIMTRGDG